MSDARLTEFQNQRVTDLLCRPEFLNLTAGQREDLRQDVVRELLALNQQTAPSALFDWRTPRNAFEAELMGVHGAIARAETAFSALVEPSVPSDPTDPESPTAPSGTQGTPA